MPVWPKIKGDNKDFSGARWILLLQDVLFEIIFASPAPPPKKKKKVHGGLLLEHNSECHSGLAE